MSTMNITDTIHADQIEDGDQIIVLGDYLEDVEVSEDPDDLSIVIVAGYSHNTGDTEVYQLAYDADVHLWSV